MRQMINLINSIGKMNNQIKIKQIKNYNNKNRVSKNKNSNN